MIKFLIRLLFLSTILPYQFNIEPDFGKILSNNIIYESPFLGGFNKPKIQWADWNEDGFIDLFLLDEDGHIRYFLNENQNFILQSTRFLDLSNILWFYIYDFDNDSSYEIIASSSMYAGGVSYYEYIEGELVYISEIVDINNNHLNIDQSMIPTFADIDGDEDLDLFSGNIIGTLNYFNNSGLNNNIPTFNLESNFWQEIYIVGQSRHGASAISFIDLDNDQDLDLSWGDYFQQSLYIVSNIGNQLNPIMDNDNIITQFPYEDPVNTAGLNLPSFIDIDNDNDSDLFVTTLSGAYGYQLTNNFMFYENVENDYLLQTYNYIDTVDLLSDINPKFVDIDFDGDLDEETLIEGANRGLVEAAGDEYTEYLTKSEADSFSNSLSGSIGGGVGIELNLRDDLVTVVRVLEDTPAEREGLQAGDIIVGINDDERTDWSIDEVVQRVRGEIGTTVRLVVLRDGVREAITLTRAEIVNPSVYSRVEDGVGIITMSRFDTQTASLARRAAQEFADSGVSGVILDMRGNGGGYINAARDVAGIWLDEKIVVIEKSGDRVVDQLRTGSNPILDGVPTIVLVDGFSASASEIVAGALQESGAAEVLGEATFGKGSVQQLITLPEGAQLKVTIARWYTPKGRSISETGITPDTVVERSLEDVNENRDPQLRAALEELSR